jgi:hypothetical protein
MEVDKKFNPAYDSNDAYGTQESLDSHSSIEKATVHEIDPVEDSPIEEVRSSVPPTDDPTLPTATFRAWFWGIVFSAAISFTNQVRKNWTFFSIKIEQN